MESVLDESNANFLRVVARLLSHIPLDRRDSVEKKLADLRKEEEPKGGYLADRIVQSSVAA